MTEKEETRSHEKEKSSHKRVTIDPSKLSLPDMAKFFEDNGRPDMAAEIYRTLDKSQDALRCFDILASTYSQKEMYGHAGNVYRQMALMSQEGEYFLRASHAYEKQVSLSKKPEEVDFWKQEAAIAKHLAEITKKERQAHSTRPYEAPEKISDQRASEGRLAQKVAGIIGFLGILSGLFLVSSNITGDVIANATLTNSTLSGVFLFIVGLIASFFYFERRNTI